MTAPTRDAVAQARREVLDARDNALRNISLEAAARLDAAWDAYDALVGAAVLAECAAKVLSIKPVAYIDLEDGTITEHDGRYPAILVRDVLAALEAQP